MVWRDLGWVGTSTRPHPGALLIPCLHMGKPGAAKGWMRGFYGKEGLVADTVDFKDLSQASDHQQMPEAAAVGVHPFRRWCAPCGLEGLILGLRLAEPDSPALEPACGSILTMALLPQRTLPPDRLLGPPGCRSGLPEVSRPAGPAPIPLPNSLRVRQSWKSTASAVSGK